MHSVKPAASLPPGREVPVPASAERAHRAGARHTCLPSTGTAS
ncbi:hypothetical protein [Yinghuangia sp. ASG 101]|nr:hypothetical protein [Yinghuangia sp. ASG 101]